MSDEVTELKRKLAAMTKWLEDNQPDVFRRGIWDVIAPPRIRAGSEAGKGGAT